MPHLLDNPIYNALDTGNSNLAKGTKAVKFFDAEVSPLIGMAEYSEENFDTLYNLTPAGRLLATITADAITVPLQWNLVNSLIIVQLVFEREHPKAPSGIELLPLQNKHVPQMLALAKLTKPGPFSERTIDFGNYKGIFVDGKLAAMAGRRLQPLPYIEVSAVCTHPDHHGNGYAGQLISDQLQTTLTMGCIPYLHSRVDNDVAIKLYQKLGFVIRTAMVYNTIKKI